MAQMIPCSICGRLFESNGFTELCSVCKVRDDETYMRLRDYLMQHPGTKIFDVSNVLDVPIYYIKRYLREERLEIIEKDNRFLTCEKCGNPIRSGRFCDACANEARNNRAFANSPSVAKFDLPVQASTDRSMEKIKYMERTANKSKRLSV